LNSGRFQELRKMNPNPSNYLDSIYTIGLMLRDEPPGEGLAHTSPSSETHNILNSTIFFAARPESKNLAQADQSFLNRLALSNLLLFKGRSTSARVGILAEKCAYRQSVEINRLCEELREVREELSSLVYGSQQKPDVAAEYKKLENRERDLDWKIRKFIVKNAESSTSSTGNSSNQRSINENFFEAIQETLPSDSALVEISRYLPQKPQPKFGAFWGDQRYAAAVLHPTGAPKWVDLGNARDVEASVAKFRNGLSDKDAAGSIATNPGNLAAVQQAGRNLDQQVMAKIRPLLGNAKHLLISADGELNLVPFEALRDETGQYLINRYQFSYLTSGRDLLSIAEARKNPQPPRQPAVILADPDYYQPAQVAKIPAGNQLSGNENTASVDSLGSFGQATGTKELAQALKAEILPNAKLLTQTAATKTALRQLQSPQILVLATHGFFLPNQEKQLETPQTEVVGSGNNPKPQSQRIEITNPLLRSGLALAGVNRRSEPNLPPDADNGVLTALEVAGLDLRGTQLVVLSACETAVGEAKVGDGVYGLRRALVIAGAQSQVLSLWKVDDAATTDLMKNYFTKVVKGKQGRHAALQAAKQEMMKDPNRQHPYYWAGFIPSGDWMPLNQ
jgi:CHAT domain-containing protein